MEISVEPSTIFDLFIPVGMHRIVIDFAAWFSSSDRTKSLLSGLGVRALSDSSQIQFVKS